MVDSIERPSSNRRSRILAISLAFIALVGGFLCRFWGASGELWLDEVWSVLHMEDISNPLQILTRARHDNNHPLNSLWIWLCGASASPLLLRAPSLIFGMTTIVTLLRWGRVRQEQTIAGIWALLVAFSYPLILTDSEARGYSLSLVCVALCFVHLSTLLSKERIFHSAIWFGVWAALGCFTHATFALFLAPAVVWIIANRNSTFLREQSAALALCGLTPPLIIGTLLTLVFYSRLEIGGAPQLPYLEVATSTLSIAFGGDPLSASSPEVSGQALFLTAFILLVIGLEMRAWMKTKDPLASLVCLILMTPLYAVTIGQPHFILSRYFLIALLFAYLVFARFLSRMSAQGILGSVTATALLGGYLIGNTSHALQLAERQRSHFLNIFSYIAEQTAGTQMTVGGTQDFQNSLRLRYARLARPNTACITYETNIVAKSESPHFYISETVDPYENLPESLELPNGAAYTAIKRYNAPLLNGSNVVLYEKKK